MKQEYLLGKARKDVSNVFKTFFFVLDNHLNFKYVAREVIFFSQIPAEELIGRNIKDEFSKPVAHFFYEKCEEALQQQKRLTEEYYLDFSAIWMTVTIDPVPFGLEVAVHNITDLKTRQSVEEFLMEVNAVLASSLDHQQVLSDLAHLCVPAMGDWCMIDLLEETGNVQRVAVAFASPSQAVIAEETKKYPPTRDNLNHPSGKALFSGESVLMEEFLLDKVQEIAHDDAHTKAILAIAPRSFIVVPLIARHKTLGVMTLMVSESDRCYIPEDLHIAEELARRAALQIDNARRYGDTQQSLKKSHRSKKRLYNLLMEVPAAICVFRGPDHTFELVNPLYKQFYGGEDFTGKKGRDLIKELGAEEQIRLLDEVYHTGKSFIGQEYRCEFDRNGDGIPEAYYFNFIYQPTYDEEGHIDGIFMFAHEVTEQVKARKVVEENAQGLKTILEAIPQMAWTARPDGYVDYYNQRWYHYTGTTFEAMKGDGWHQVLHPDDLQATSRRWQHSLETGESYEMENRYKKISTGEYRWHLTLALPIHDDRGNILMWVGSCTDVHEQKMALQSLDDTRQKLDVINQELNEKNEALIRSNNNLDQFVYTASHDLKAPMANIEGLVSLLSERLGQKEIADRSLSRLFEMMHNAIKKFQTTVQDLTDAANIQQSQSHDVRVIDIQDLIEEVKILIRDKIEESDAAIVAHTGELPRITFSYARLKSLLYNLLSNAVKYRHPERKPEIMVKTSQEANGFCRLSVQDNGLGIDPQQTDKIFTMFKRFHRHVDGSGVGLFLVKKIVENAGGSIEVKSKLDKGTTFYVYLRNQ